MSLDGYYKGSNEDISWHIHDTEGGELAREGAQTGNTLLFGRVTYELMARYWPTAMARESLPEVAQGMNQVEKIVFSRTMKHATWHNTKIVSGDMLKTVRDLKQFSGNDLTILGSGSIVTQLSAHGLIDEFMFMLDPIALGDGTPIFKGLPRHLKLAFKEVKSFKSGAVLLTYQKK